MSMVVTLILTVQLLSALGMIGLILVQHGKGADMGAAFGSGGSGSLFGASGSANFLSRATAVLATLFFICTLALAYFSNLRPSADSGSVLERTSVTVPSPAVAASGAAQIPAGSTVPSGGASAVANASGKAAVPQSAASGAGQIPTK